MMHSFTTFFLYALAACILLQGSFAEDQSGYICLIDDPMQNQCDSICLTELSPRLSEVVKAQNQGNTNIREFDKEIKSKLETLEAKMEGRLQGVENKMERRLQGLGRQLQEVQTKLEAKLGESLLAVQGKIENQLQAVLNQLQLVQKKIDVPKVVVPALSTISIPPGFELFGNRYFIIVKKNVKWETAERRCREMGGYLASFRNEEEINAIKPKLGDWWYWIGINDRENEGHFVSVASHKPAPFIIWDWGEPSDRNHEKNCVKINNGKMSEHNCNDDGYCICQADNET